MISKRPPSLEARRTLRLIEAIIGTTRIRGIVIALLVIISIGWFGDSVLSLFDLLFDDKYVNSPKIIAGAVFLPLVIVGLMFYIRKARIDVSVDVKTDTNPPQIQALILILSPPRGDDELLTSCQGEYLEKNGELLERFNGWRMPMGAIAHHLGRLKRIIVVPSADRNGINLVTQEMELIPGTWSSFENFKKLVTMITSRYDIMVQSVGELDPDFEKGIDFESIDVLVSAIDGIYKTLKQEKFPEYDILIDITGGQKTPGVAGAIVALAEGRRFQYISPADKKAMTFDITYE